VFVCITNQNLPSKQLLAEYTLIYLILHKMELLKMILLLF